MKYHKDLDVLLSEDLSTQKDSCLWEEKQEEVAGSQVAHIRKPVRLFFTDLVLEKVALAWRLWLQSMSRTVYKEPSPGLIVWDGSEIPQMGDTRRGGSFVSSFFCLKHLLCPEWSLTYCFHDGEAATQLGEDQAPGVSEGMLHVCSRNGCVSDCSHARVHTHTEMLFQFAIKQYRFGV